MSLCTIGTRSVVTTDSAKYVAQVACLMNDRGVGSVVVVEDGKPVGMITDRDLVIRVLCKGRDVADTKASDVMTSPVVTIDEKRESLEAATVMRENQVRRLPVVGEDGSLIGIVCLDDLTFHLSRCYHEMAEAIAQFPVPHAGG